MWNQGTFPCGSVRLDRRLAGADVHPVVRFHRDLPERARAQAEQFTGSLRPAMCGDERRTRAHHP